MLEGKKDFLDTDTFSKEALIDLINLSSAIKKNPAKYSSTLKKKKLGMIFEKSSTRTRVSFEAGIYEMGGMGIFLSSRDIQLGRGESVEDTARVMSRYLDAIMIRSFKQDYVESLAANADIPVINGLTDLLHPCQAMADFQTIIEYKGTFRGIKVCYIGDGNNVAHSLALLSTKLGTDFAIATPEKYRMQEAITKKVLSNAALSGSNVFITTNPLEAVRDADVIYTDVWVSMGMEEESDNRMREFKGFQVNSMLVRNARPDFIFMHCLPAHRGEEVTGEIIDGDHSAVFDQAENRLHSQKAIMFKMMRGT